MSNEVSGVCVSGSPSLTEGCLWRSFQQDPRLRPALRWDGAALFSATKCWDHFHSLCTADDLKMPFLWGAGRNFCLIPQKLRCSSSTFPVLNSRVLHYTGNLGFSCSLKCGICMFVFRKHQLSPLGCCGRTWGGLSALPEQRHFLNNWIWFVCPVFCGVSLTCEE